MKESMSSIHAAFIACELPMTRYTPVTAVTRKAIVSHVEAFVVPVDGAPDLTALSRARELLCNLDWKVQDAVIVPVEELPEEFLPGLREDKAGHDAS